MSKIDYSKLLNEALTQEGKLSSCYQMFWNYSFGNQIWAIVQLGKAEPINTYKGWQALGRQVKGGSKAIELVMPVTIKEDKTDPDSETKTIFVFRNNWFGLSQTTGDDYKLPEAIPFNKTKVLAALGVTEHSFDKTDGNVQGYAHEHELAINPVAKYPLKTLWHELGHIVLGHTEQRVAEATTLPRSLREVEAEAVAYLLCNVFNYDQPKVESRGYIQDWITSETIPADSAKRIINAVGQILKANTPVK